MIGSTTYRRTTGRLSSLAFLILAGVAMLPARSDAQDVYVVEWTIQDPDSRLLQDLASRTIDAINFWLTRENVAAQTVRLDDPLRITVIGRYQPRTGSIVEEIVRIRAGSILVEDDPHLYLTSGLIDTLLRRNYYWQEERVDLVDPSLAPGYLHNRSEDTYGSGIRRVVEPPDFPADYQPVVTLALPGRWSVWGDVGNHIAELPGLSYGRVRFGVSRVFGGLWGELPFGPDRGGILGPSSRPTGGIGGYLNLRFATISASLSLFREPDTTRRADTIRLATSIVAYGTHSFPDPVFGSMFGSLDLGGGLYEGAYTGPTVNGIPTERTELDFRPLVRLRLYPGVGRNDQILRLISIQTSLWSLQAGGSIRILPNLDIQVGGTIHGLIGDRAPFQPPATIWITPSFRFAL